MSIVRRRGRAAGVVRVVLRLHTHQQLLEHRAAIRHQTLVHGRPSLQQLLLRLRRARAGGTARQRERRDEQPRAPVHGPCRHRTCLHSVPLRQTSERRLPLARVGDRGPDPSARHGPPSDAY